MMKYLRARPWGLAKMTLWR